LPSYQSKTLLEARLPEIVFPVVIMAPSLDSANFSAPPHILEVEGVLTDFDGTIIDSTDAIVKHWHK